MTIGERINLIRKYRGLSREELGAAVNVLVPTKKITADRIQKYENGHRTPREDVLRAIAEVLDVNYDSLSAPDISPDNLLTALFDLEDYFDIALEETEDAFVIKIEKNSDHNRYNQLFYDLGNWLAAKQKYMPKSSESGEDITRKKAEYDFWKRLYPMDTVGNEKRKMQMVDEKYQPLVKQYKDKKFTGSDIEFAELIMDLLRTGVDEHFIRKTVGYGISYGLASFAVDNLLSLEGDAQKAFVRFLANNLYMSNAFGMEVEVATHTELGNVYIDYVYKNQEIKFVMEKIENIFKPAILNGTFEDGDVQTAYERFCEYPTSFEALMKQGKINS